MKKYRLSCFLRILFKGLLAVISFCLIFVILQELLVPKFMNESTTTVKGYSQLEPNSLDVLFLGSSQMFCTVNAKKLTEEYGISSFDFGASSQPLTVTEYYLREALKTQKPKLVVVEICTIFNCGTKMTDAELAWSYAPMPASKEKFESLLKVTQNRVKSIEYCYFPLLIFHNRWNYFGRESFETLYKLNTEDYSCFRGFLPRDHIEKVDLSNPNNSGGGIKAGNSLRKSRITSEYAFLV